MSLKSAVSLPRISEKFDFNFVINFAVRFSVFKLNDLKLNKT